MDTLKIINLLYYLVILKIDAKKAHLKSVKPDTMKPIKTFIVICLFPLASFTEIGPKVEGNCKSEVPAGMNFARSFPITFEDRKHFIVEHSYVLTKETTYAIQLCNTDRNGNRPPEITLLDSKRNKVATNIIKGKTRRTITYTSPSTQFFYLRYTAQDSIYARWESIVSFSRDK
jgi:hypothetical protein